MIANIFKSWLRFLATIFLFLPTGLMAQRAVISTNALQPFPTNALWNGVVNFQPGNATTAAINPPLFSWSYTPAPTDANADQRDKAFNLQVSYSTNFNSTNNLILNVYTPWNFYNFLAPFTNSPVYWRVGYIEVTNTTGLLVTNGLVDTWTPVYRFTITNGTPLWDRSMLANTNYLTTKAVHPRMLINAGNIATVSSWLTANNTPAWQSLVASANAAITNSWWTNGDPTQQAYVSAIRCQQVANAAFVWQVTQSPILAKANLPAALDALVNVYLDDLLDQQDVVTISDQSYIRDIALAYDWLYPIMNQAQRSNALYAIQANCKFILRGGEFWWQPYNSAYAYAAGDPNRVYAGPYYVPCGSHGKMGNSHPWVNFTGAFAAAIAAQGDGSTEVDTFWQMGLNYALAKGFPFSGGQGLNEGRIYSFQDSMDSYKQLWNVMALSLIYPEAALTNNPFYQGLADWLDRMIPAYFSDGHEPWGDSGWGRLTFWCDSQSGRDLSLFTGSGTALLHYSNELYATYGQYHWTPPYDPVDEIAIPCLFPSPQPTTDSVLAALYPEDGWVVSESSPPNTPAFMTNGVGFVFQARPSGDPADYCHAHLSDGSFEIWAYGANITDAGAQLSAYAQVPWCHYTLLVNGLGQCQRALGPIDPFCSFIYAYTNNSDMTYCAADLTRAYARSNFQASGWILPQQFCNLHSGGPLSYVTSVTRQILFEHKKYFVIYDTLQTSNPPTNTFSWIYHILAGPVALNTNSMAFVYNVTNMYTGSTANVYVAFVNNPSELAVTNMTGTNVRSNPITGENYYTQGDSIVRSNALWFSNLQPTNYFHFMTVIYPVPPGGSPPTMNRLDDDTLSVNMNDGVSPPDVICFNPLSTNAGSATLLVNVPYQTTNVGPFDSLFVPSAFAAGASTTTTTSLAQSSTTPAISAPQNLHIVVPYSESQIVPGYWAWWNPDTIASQTGSPVGSWTDSSSAARAAVQSTVANQPILSSVNGHNTLRFNGNNSSLAWANSADLPQPIEVITVLQPFTLTNLMTCFGTQNVTYPLKFDFVAQGDTYGLMAGNYVGVPGSGSTNWAVVTFVANGTNSEVFINSICAVTGNAGTAGMSGAVIGARQDQGYAFWNGQIADIIVYTNILGPSQQQTVENALRSKYGF